jgi:hypothetical protein
MNFFFSALLGGVVSAIFFPFVVYYGIRYYNTYKLSISIDNRRDDFQYLLIANNSISRLKSVLATISIDNNETDVYLNEHGYCTTTITHEMTSWAKAIDGKNRPEIDLNPGENQRLNVLYNNGESLIQIASEESYW